MKNGWQRKHIRDLCEVIAGQSPEGKFYNADGSGMPFYQGKKDFGEKFIAAPTTWTTETTKIAREGDILMSVRAPVGPVNFATDEVCIGRGLAAIRSGAELSRDFLFYQLLHLQPDIAGKEGAVFASINKSEIEALPLAFAPLLEQQRIVGILDKAFDSIATAKANAEKNLQNARALFESQFQSVFAQCGGRWVQNTIAQCFRVRSGDFLPAKAMIQTGNFDVYGGNGIAGRHDRRNLTGDNIIIGRVGAKCGNVRHVRGDVWVTDNAFFIAEYFHAFDLRFLARALERKRLGNTANQMAQPVISYTTIKDVLLEFPDSKTEQTKIADELEALSKKTERLESIYQRKLSAIDELKRSLLNQAFAGEL